MKNLFYILVFSLLMTEAHGSEGLNEYELKSCDDLSELIDDYLTCIPNHLGCDCCQTIHEIFKTKKFQYVAAQQEKLKEFKRGLKKPPALGQILLMSDTLLSYEDIYGPIFDRKFRKVVISQIENKNKEALGPDCCYCKDGDGEEIFLSACGHARVCKPCLEKEGPACPDCKIKIKIVYKRTACLLCGQVEARCLHEQCAHLDICENCMNQRQRTSCLVCGANGEWRVLK